LQLDAFSQAYGFPWLGIFIVTVVGAVLRFGLLRRAAGIALLLLYALYVIGLITLPAFG
jgi:Ca2+/Na+ antiporter